MARVPANVKPHLPARQVTKHKRSPARVGGPVCGLFEHERSGARLKHMSEFASVTDADLARARQDQQFRHKLVAENLEHLLAALNKLRASTASSDPDRTGQIKEGVDLAVKLADVLHKIAEGQKDRASAA